MPLSLARLFCAVVLLAAAPLAVAASIYDRGGYADRTSVLQGGTISFHIATSVSPFTLEIVNLAQPNSVLTTIPSLTSSAIDCNGMWEEGCGWPVTTQFTIPAAWPSGYYAARFPTSGGTRNLTFVVRAANPGIASPVVVVSASNTAQAYNQFGGKSVYDSISTNNQRAHIVSFERPYFDNLGLGRYPAWEQKFVDFMTAENRTFEVITDDDLADPNLLGNYRLVLLVGHSEYWTLTARQTLEAYINGGGNVAVFGGNSMWWQARVDLTERQFTVYKSAALDPLNGVQNELVTVNWYDSPVYHPENTALGSSFRNAAYANVAPGTFTALPIAERTPYTVIDASSWVFSGTGLLNGQTFGQASAGTETDGVVFNTLPGGELVVDGSDGAPLTFQILATLPAEEGYGTIGYYTNANGGAVFNVGTRDWTIGLASDAAVQQITRNVIERMSVEEPLPHAERTTVWRAEELFNTASPMPGVLTNWSGDMLQATLSASCAHEGPTGLEMKGAEWTQFIRDFAPDHVGISTATVQFQLNADALMDTPTFSMPIVELIDETTSLHVYAAVELQKRPQGKSIRLSLYRDNGSRSGTTSWEVLPPGWQQVVMEWRSPGTCRLDVGSSIHLQLENSEPGQGATEVMLEFAGSELGATGSICLDALQLRDTIGPPVVLPAPSSVDAETTTVTKVAVSWSAVANAASYRVERSIGNGGFAEVATVNATLFQDTNVAANTAYLYRVIALDSIGTVGIPSAPALAMTRQFSRDPKRIIRAAHINDLRDAIDDLRVAFGLGNASYTRTIAAGKKVKAFDLTEMRSAVDAARTAAGLRSAVLGIDTHALSEPALASALEVFWRQRRRRDDRRARRLHADAGDLARDPAYNGRARRGLPTAS
jgi:hypothetical protein